MNLLILFLLAVDIPDLGVITPRTGATISLNSTRPGFVWFLIEVKPSVPPTNLVALTLTNNLLTVGDMAPVPSGPGILGVRSIYSDGEESEVALYRYDLRRSKPSAPSMSLTHVGGPPEPESSLTNEMRRIRERRAMPTPPAPEYTSGLQYDQPKRKQIVYIESVKPLPGGTNLSYGQFRDRLADAFQWGRRRSQ